MNKRCKANARSVVTVDSPLVRVRRMSRKERICCRLDHCGVAGDELLQISADGCQLTGTIRVKPIAHHLNRPSGSRPTMLIAGCCLLTALIVGPFIFAFFAVDSSSWKFGKPVIAAVGASARSIILDRSLTKLRPFSGSRGLAAQVRPLWIDSATEAGLRDDLSVPANYSSNLLNSPNLRGLVAEPYDNAIPFRAMSAVEVASLDGRFDRLRLPKGSVRNRFWPESSGFPRFHLPTYPNAFSAMSRRASGVEGQVLHGQVVGPVAIWDASTSGKLDELNMAIRAYRRNLAELEQSPADLAISRNYYAALAELAHQLLIAQDNSLMAIETKQQAFQLLSELHTDADLRKLASSAAPGWVGWSKRKTPGIVLSGRVVDIENQGGLCRVHIAMSDRKGSTMQVALSPDWISRLHVEDELVVAGLIARPEADGGPMVPRIYGRIVGRLAGDRPSDEWADGTWQASLP